MREVWKLSFILILVLFVAHAPKIFFGLGLADSGHHIARQQELFLFGEIRGSAAVTLLSDVFGGLWLKFTGNKSLLWVRIGGALLNCLNALTVFLILKDYFSIRKAFVSVLISAIMIVLISPYQLFISYYSVPAFIITLAIYFLHKALSCQNNLIEKCCIYSVGISLFALSAARVPLIVLPITVIISLSVAYFWTGEEYRNKILHVGILLFAGILTGAAVFWIYLSLQGLLETYLESIYLAFSSSPLNDVTEYSPSTLFPMYLNLGIKAVILAGFGTFFLMLINRYRFGSSSIPLYLLTALTGIVLLFAKSNGPIQGLLRFREILIGFIVICSACVLVN